MDIQNKMKETAGMIIDRLSAGELVSKKDMRFLRSYLNIDTKKAPSAGKQWKSKKSGINR